MSIALRLKAARAAAHITQQDLADRARVPLRTLQAIEMGNVANPGVETLWAIATALGVKIDDLVDFGSQEHLKSLGFLTARDVVELIEGLLRAGPLRQSLVLYLATGHDKFLGRVPVGKALRALLGDLSGEIGE